MLKNYLRIALRNLTRTKLHTGINVFGLAVGIAVCLLIMLFVQSEWSYDGFHKNRGRIFRVIESEKKPDGERQHSAFNPMPLAPALRAEIPEIETAVRVYTGSGFVMYDEKIFGEELHFTDAEFLSLFHFPLLRGDAKTALVQPNAVVLTEPLAQKYFGAEDPLGKSLRVSIQDKQEDFFVTGVARDVPENSSLQFQILLSIVKHRSYERVKDRWNNFNGTVFVELQERANAAEVEDKFPPFVQKYFGAMIAGNQKEGYLSRDEDAFRLHLQPLAEVYLGSTHIMGQEKKSDPRYSYSLCGIAGLVLLVACINFMTLSIARSARRAKEVGLRKVLGAVRVQLLKQFWGEALLLALIAFVLGLGFAELLLPTFNQFAAKHLALRDLFNGEVSFALLGLWLLVGLLAGGYPSFFLSRFQPVAVLKGTTKLGGKNFFTQSLVVFQFGLSIFLTVAALAMSAQLRFLITKDLGYNAEQVVIIPLHTGANSNGEEIVARFKDRLAGHGGIINICGTTGAFTRGYDRNSFEHEGKIRKAYVHRVDTDFLATLDIRLLEGRNFSKESGTDAREAIIVNEALVRDFEWQPPIMGKRLSGWDEKNLPGGPVVIGVVKDFNFRSLHEEVAPALLFMNPDWSINEMLVRIAPANVAQTLALVEKNWKEVAPNRPFEFSFLDDEVQRQYQFEQRWGRIVQTATAFALVLAGLGLLGLSTLAATNRTKEVGIRKVLGASVRNVTGLLSAEFVKLVLLANVLAWPVAYFVVNKFLQNYAYHITLGPQFFLLAAVLALAVAFLTVSAQALKAARANPVEASRYE